jgi:transposase
MGTRRRFSAEFKAKVALEAIQGHLTVAELATRPRLRPGSERRSRSWPQVFEEKGSVPEQNHNAELTKLHAKIGQLVVERDFCRKPSIAEPGSEENDDRPRSSRAVTPRPFVFGEVFAVASIELPRPNDTGETGAEALALGAVAAEFAKFRAPVTPELLLTELHGADTVFAVPMPEVVKPVVGLRPPLVGLSPLPSKGDRATAPGPPLVQGADRATRSGRNNCHGSRGNGGTSSELNPGHVEAPARACARPRVMGPC